MYRRETFGQYLGRQLKQALKIIGLVWMMVGAPGGTIILGIFAFGNPEGWRPEVKMYLTWGFGFCVLCTLITISFALYNDYQSKLKSRELNGR